MNSRNKKTINCIKSVWKVFENSPDKKFSKQDIATETGLHWMTVSNAVGFLISIDKIKTVHVENSRYDKFCVK